MEKPLNLPNDVPTRILRSVLPDVAWILKYAEKEDSWIRFPPQLVRILSGGALNGYVDMYEDERRIAVCMVFGIFGEDEGKELFKELTGTPLEEQAEFSIALLEAVDEGVEIGFRIPRTDKEMEEADKLFNRLPAGEKELIRRRQIFFFSGFLSSFFQYISVMVHGEKLTSLVTQAIEGDTQAFVKAVQIDRNLLVNHKVFRERVTRAQLEGDAKFLDALGYRLRNPIAKGKIRYRELWFSLSVLDSLGFLEGLHTHAELIEILRQAGLDLLRNGIEDECYFAKRLKDYRKFQGRADRFMLTPE